MLSLVKASQPTVESILDSFCSLGIVKESDQHSFCLSEKSYCECLLTRSVHIPNSFYTNSSVPNLKPYSSLIKVVLWLFD